MKSFNFLIASMLALIFCSLSAYSQSTTGRTIPAFNSLTSEYGTESGSLAGSSLSRSTGLDSDLLSSPVAMINSKDRFGVGLSYTSWMPMFGPDRKMRASAAFNNSNLSFGFNSEYSLSAKYPIYNEFGTPTGDFSPSSLRIDAGIGFRIVKGFTTGIDLKYVRSSEAENLTQNCFAAGIHFGFVTGRLSTYLGIRDLGPSVKSEDGKAYTLPSSIAGSVSYGLIDAGRSRLFLDAAGYCYLSGGVSAAIGTEYSFDSHFFTRAGYRYASQTAPLASFASLGIGIKFFGISINATYLLASKTLGGTYLIGLSYSL